MPANLTVYNLGSKGVNVDVDQIHLEDGELTKAQNASQDPLGGSGGLRKRQGLTKFNSSTAAGSIVGGLGVPLSYQGTLSTATATIYLGNFDLSSLTSLGWFTSTTGFTTTATKIASSTPSNPVNPNNFTDAGVIGFFSNKYWYGHAACTLNNRIYYAANNYTKVAGSLATTSPTIYAYDGTFDEPVVRVSGCSAGILTMATLNNSIYLTTCDSGRATNANIVGRVFNLTPDGVLTQLGAVFPLGRVPFCLTWAFGKLWCGTHAGNSGGHSTTVEIYWIRPLIDTAWTLDRTVAASNVGVMSMVTYHGALYAGYVNDNTNAALVEKRTALGVWSTADTGVAGAGAFNPHGYHLLTVFGDNLYALRYGEHLEGTTIRKYNGTSWSSARVTATAATNTAPYTNSLQYNGVLYVSGAYGSNVIGVYTSDGTTWTDMTMPAGGSNPNGVSPAMAILLT